MDYYRPLQNHDRWNYLDLDDTLHERSSRAKNKSHTDYERSSLANNTKNKTVTIKDELKYLDLAAADHLASIDADLNFAGKNFTDYAELTSRRQEKNIKNNLIETRSKRLAAYTGNDVQKLFDFKKNGFEFRSTNDEDLLKILKSTRKDNPYLFEDETLELTGKLVEKWAAEKKMEDVIVIPLSMVYRSEVPSKNVQPVAGLTHVDFKKNPTKSTDNYRNLFLSVKPKIEDALNRNLTDEEFSNLELELMVNVWMPLQDAPTENTLAMMDTAGLDDKELRPFTNEVLLEGPTGVFSIPFTVMTMRPSKRQQFIIQSDMKRGDYIIFDTLNTPHSAVKAPRKEAMPGLPRDSVEVRVFVIKKGKKPQ